MVFHALLLITCFSVVLFGLLSLAIIILSSEGSHLWPAFHMVFIQMSTACLDYTSVSFSDFIAVIRASHLINDHHIQYYHMDAPGSTHFGVAILQVLTI